MAALAAVNAGAGLLLAQGSSTSLDAQAGAERVPTRVVRIFIVGPKHAGKTTLSNFIASREHYNLAQYHPTLGVRIVEAKRVISTPSAKDGDRSTVLIQLWDFSGDESSKAVCSALGGLADAILIVYNQENKQHDPVGWYTACASAREPSSVAVFSNHFQPHVSSKARPAKALGQAAFHPISISGSPVEAQQAFNAVLQTCLSRG